MINNRKLCNLIDMYGKPILFIRTYKELLLFSSTRLTEHFNATQIMPWITEGKIFSEN
jgi:hypothetical protein